MEIGKHIQHYRHQLELSQEQLAEKCFVSRQSVSNWERGATYPDIQTLLLLSHIFDVNLDNLVKDDLPEMKRIIHQADYPRYEKDSKIFACLLILLPILMPPLFLYLEWYGVGLACILFFISYIYAMRIEAFKKKYDIQTYKELLAYDQGTPLSTIEEIQEKAKRPYEKMIIVAIVSLIAIVIGLISLGLSLLALKFLG